MLGSSSEAVGVLEVVRISTLPAPNRFSYNAYARYARYASQIRRPLDECVLQYLEAIFDLGELGDLGLLVDELLAIEFFVAYAVETNAIVTTKHTALCLDLHAVIH